MPDYSTHIVAALLVGLALSQNYFLLAIIFGGILPDLLRKAGLVFSHDLDFAFFLSVALVTLGFLNEMFWLFCAGTTTHYALDFWKNKKNGCEWK